MTRTNETRDPAVYDWNADPRAWESNHSTNPVEPKVGVVVPRAHNEGLNPVTGHGEGCQCPRCPGWYAVREGRVTGVVPAPRKANALQDMVIPISVLMVVFTLCMLPLVPVVAPLVQLTTISLGMLVVALGLMVVMGLLALWMFAKVKGDLK